MTANYHQCDSDKCLSLICIANETNCTLILTCVRRRSPESPRWPSPQPYAQPSDLTILISMVRASLWELRDVSSSCRFLRNCKFSMQKKNILTILLQIRYITLFLYHSFSFSPFHYNADWHA